MSSQPASKGNAVPATLSRQQKAAQTKARQRAEADKLVRDHETRLAQVVNLMIAGHTPGEIGLAIGATADEVEKMITRDAARYVRSQPALRAYVRNWISSKYTALLEAIWDDATDMNTQQKLTVQGFDRKLASQDRAIKILAQMAKLHGADAPTQTEIKVEAAPEQVDRLVQALAASQGQGYDVSVFDIVEAEVVHEAAVEAGIREAVSGNEIDAGVDDAE